MSRTYGSKYDFNKNLNKEDDYKSLSEIYTSGDINAAIKTRRHPNKKKKRRCLGKEFHEVGLDNPAYWKYKYGEVGGQSNRLHLVRREIAAKRRNRLKHEAEEEIERSLEQEN